MDILIISLVAIFASLMNFLSGFGLGTLLLPALAIYFPLHIAIILTAIVHLMTNVFKSIIMRKHVKWKVFIKFGIPSIIFAAIGAFLLNQIVKLDLEFSYSLFKYHLTTSPINITIAIIMIISAILDLIPSLQDIKIPKKILPFGGALSGFFGGLSGHQGAIRSAFLIKLDLPKEKFVATGIFISLFVDISRLLVYEYEIVVNGLEMNYDLLIAASFFAIIGAILGKYFLKQVTIKFVRFLLGILLILVSIAIGLGVI
jgi:uncharacterized protein